MRLKTFAKICHHIETLFSAMQEGELKFRAELFDTLHESVDSLARLNATGGKAGDAAAEEDMRRILLKLRKLVSADAAAGVADAKPARESGTASPKPAASKPAVRTPAVSGTLNNTIRIATEKLDGILFQTEEMLAAKLACGQRAVELRSALSEIELWKKEFVKVFDTVRSAKRAARKHSQTSRVGNSTARYLEKTSQFLQANDRLIGDVKTRLEALAKSTMQDYHILGGMVDNLLEDTKELLMLPFATLSQIFPRLVRDVARSLGKDVDLVIEGKDLELDKRILEEMKDPLVHLVRNCLDHGLETPAERERANKPAQGTVTISLSQVDAGRVELRISDDGRGIDVEKVKQSAIRNGMLSEEKAETLDKQAGLMLIFKSQVSTSEAVTDLSGRGLGMSIVLEKIENLGGSISVESELGGGSSFRISLPTRMARFRGIMVEAGQQQFIIPTAQCPARHPIVSYGH